MNSGFAFKQAPTTNEHFIVGDFIVIDTQDESSLPTEPKMRMKLDNNGCIVVKRELPVNPATGASVSVVNKNTEGCGLRFDERFLLKEDYDFTAQHLEVLSYCSLSLSFSVDIFSLVISPP